MSECVVRMEMPQDKNCLLNFSLPKLGPWCWIEDRACDYYKTNNRPDWCPIICQLPEGHGRLIDQDALEIEECSGCINRNHKYINCMDCALANSPIIVPAERSET